MRTRKSFSTRTASPQRRIAELHAKIEGLKLDLAESQRAVRQMQTERQTTRLPGDRLSPEDHRQLMIRISNFCTRMLADERERICEHCGGVPPEHVRDVLCESEMARGQ